MRVCDEWLLTPFRLAIHEPTATAVIADVHLGYREARQEAGDAVPLLDVAAQLAPLARAQQRFHFESLVVAGDLFERGVNRALLHEFLRELEAIKVVCAGLVPGNHDRGWETLASVVPMFPDGVPLGNWHVVHDLPASRPGAGPPLACASGSFVQGHWHPAVRLHGRRVPCYLVGPRRIILPAFSSDASGGIVDRSAIGSSLRCLAVSAGRLVDCPTAGKNENPRRRLRGVRRATGSAGSATRYQ